MNPCPQGYDCDMSQNCRCTPEQQRRHKNKLSAPFLDRIDLQVNVLKQQPEVMRASADSQQTAAAKEKILQARTWQIERQGTLNQQLQGKKLEHICALKQADETLLFQAVKRLKLSGRSHHRILRVARSIADLATSEHIQTPHLTEALSYRALDQWGI